MTREDFVKAEAAALRRHMDKHAVDDMLHPSSVHYSREYCCGCGFTTSDAGAIWDHAAGCGEETRAAPVRRGGEEQGK